MSPVEAEVQAEGLDGEPEPSRKGRRIRLALGAAVAALATAVVVAAELPSSPRPAGRRPSLTGSVQIRLPPRLAFVGTGGGGSSGLYLGDGAGRHPALASSGVGTVLDWSADGRRLALVDTSGNVRLSPGGGALTGPARTVAFSPDGHRLAVCVDGPWPPTVRVLDAARTAWRSPGVPGCDPEWSADGSYIAYRIPVRPESGRDPHRFDPVRFRVMNVRLGITFTIRGRWPVAWAPDPAHTIAPLAAVSARGGAVVLMDPRGGRRRTLVGAGTLRRIAGGRPLAPIALLSWSLDGREMAVGFRLEPGQVHSLGQGVAVVHPGAGEGSFIQIRPSSLSWAPSATLLAEGVGPTGRNTMLVIAGAALQSLIEGMREGSWSPDGRWILARGPRGWMALLARDTGAQVLLPGSGGWLAARWCCPPVPVTRLGPGTTSPVLPARLRQSAPRFLVR